MALSLPNTFLQTPPIYLPTKAKPSGRRNFSGQVTCRKKDIHPEFYEDAKVYCNGELVMTTGGTKKEYVVDVWSGNHPFYLGGRSQNLVDDDQVEKFRKKFGELSQIMEIPVLKGEIVIPSRRKSKGKKKNNRILGIGHGKLQCLAPSQFLHCRSQFEELPQKPCHVVLSLLAEFCFCSYYLCIRNIFLQF